MTTFVMIHGAWHGGWSFDPLRARLIAAGHYLDAPDLPGMGTADPTLQDWAYFAVAHCRKARPGKVILCGHSRGGIVLSQAAETDPAAMDALVYICAQMIPNGISRVDWKARQVPNPAFNDLILPGDGVTTIDIAHAPPVFAQMSPPDLIADAMSRLKAEPDRPRMTALSLTGERYGTVPRHYIECLHDRTIPIEDQRMMQAIQPCASTRALDADHSPFLSAPDALVDALLAIDAEVPG